MKPGSGSVIKGKEDLRGRAVECFEMEQAMWHTVIVSLWGTAKKQ